MHPHDTHTGPKIFHPPPCGQTHLKVNVAESDSEQFLMARLSHYRAPRHACVCVRYVQVRVTTYYEGPAARWLTRWLTVPKVTDEPATSETAFDLGGRDSKTSSR